MISHDRSPPFLTEFSYHLPGRRVYAARQPPGTLCTGGLRVSCRAALPFPVAWAARLNVFPGLLPPSVYGRFVCSCRVGPGPCRIQSGTDQGLSPAMAIRLREGFTASPGMRVYFRTGRQWAARQGHPAIHPVRRHVGGQHPWVHSRGLPARLRLRRGGTCAGPPSRCPQVWNR